MFPFSISLPFAVFTMAAILFPRSGCHCCSRYNGVLWDALYKRRIKGDSCSRTEREMGPLQFPEAGLAGDLSCSGGGGVLRDYSSGEHAQHTILRAENFRAAVPPTICCLLCDIQNKWPGTLGTWPIQELLVAGVTNPPTFFCKLR